MVDSQCCKCGNTFVDYDFEKILSNTRNCTNCNAKTSVGSNVVCNPLAVLFAVDDTSEISLKNDVYSRSGSNIRNLNNNNNYDFELCSLRQFVKGERRQQHTQQFLVLVHKVDDQVELSLNFTHRAAFGT